MLPSVRASFRLSPVEIGVIATVSELTSGLITLPGGFIVDILRRHWGLVLALSMASFGAGWLLLGWSPTYPILLAAITVVSVASSIWHLPSTGILSTHFSERRGVALSVSEAGGNIGDISGPVATGFLLGFLTWQETISAYAAIPLLLTFMVFWGFKNIGRTQSTANTYSRFKEQLELTKILLTDGRLWTITIVMGLRGMAYLAIYTFLPIYMTDELQLSTHVIGLHIGALSLVGIATTPVLGYLSDRLGRKLVLVPSLFCLCALSMLIVTTGEGVVWTILLIMLGFFLYSDQPILTATALDLVGKDVTTTTLGILTFFRSVLSAASPLLAGLLYQTRGIDTVFYFTAGLFALASLMLLCVPLSGIRNGGILPHEQPDV